MGVHGHFAALHKGGFSLGQFSQLRYGYANTAQTAAQGLTTIPDASPGARAMVTSGTATARPSGLPRNWAQKGQGVYGFNVGLSQWAQDQGAGAAAYAASMIRPGQSFVARVQFTGRDANDQQMATTWAGASTGTDGFSVSFTGANNPATSQIHVRKCDSVVGGDLLLGQAVTPAGAIKTFDVMTIQFRHLANRTWTLTVQRESRFPGDPVPAPIVVTGTSFDTGVTAPIATTGMTLGARNTLATVFTAMKLHSFVAFTENANSNADVAAYLAWIASTCQFPYLAFDADSPLLLASDFFDSTHWNDAGHSKVGLAWRLMEQAGVTRSGRAPAAQVVYELGDSRKRGAGASTVLLNSRHICQNGVFTYARTCNAPLNDGSGVQGALHGGRDNHSTRTTTPQGLSTPGISQRSPSATSIDTSFGPGQLYNGSNRVGCVLGVNELIQTDDASLLYDYVDELCRIVEFCYANSTSGDFGFDLGTETLNGNELAGGPLTRSIRSRNREYHAMMAYLRAILPGNGGFGNFCDNVNQP